MNLILSTTLVLLVVFDLIILQALLGSWIVFKLQNKRCVNQDGGEK